MKHKIISLAKGIRYYFGKTLMFLIGKVFDINEKTVIFSSFGGRSYSDNPRAISEYLHEKHPEYNIIWLFNNVKEKDTVLPSYIKAVKNSFLKSMYFHAISKFWVSNNPIPNYFYKNKNQVYIQTWHGDRGLKKILYDYWTLLPNGKYAEGELWEATACDVMTVGSSFGERKLRGAFNYKGIFLKYGSPRNDILINNDINLVTKVRKQLGIPENAKVLLYAPTFRMRDKINNELQSIDKIDLIETLNCLELKTNSDWVCLIRSHSSIKGFSRDFTSDKIIEASNYEDMRHLLLIADFFITDYSSSSGDFFLRKKPMVLFQADRDEYMNMDRNFYFDISESPFLVANSQKELIKIINELTDEDVKRNCEQLHEFYGVYETGKSTKKVVDFIINHY